MRGPAPDRAKAQAREFGVPRSGTVAELLADSDVELVINLTRIPAVHTNINRAILQAGKHVFCEKPFALNRHEAAELLELARGKNLRIGSAPDTFLGEAHQTSRKLIDEGALGEVVAATAFMASHGVEHWHPNPAFYYQPGGGPMFDMGPYYLTALVNMIGPMARVTGFAKTSFKERMATAAGLAGTKIEVTTPTHITGAVEFANGAVATIIMSFDVWGHNLPLIQVHGTRRSLNVPDPNGTHGTPRIYTPETKAGTMSPSPTQRSTAKNTGAAWASPTWPKRFSAAAPTGQTARWPCTSWTPCRRFWNRLDQGREIDLRTGCERPAPV